MEWRNEAEIMLKAQWSDGGGGGWVRDDVKWWGRVCGV